MCCSTVLFDCKCIHISKTLQRILCPDAKDGKKTRIVIDTPKSKSSNRIVPLSDFLFEKLSAHRSDDPETYVLTGKEKYMEPRVFEYHFDKLMRTCALQDVHFHTLRHPYVKHTTKKYNSEKQKTQATKIVDLIAWGFCFCFVCYSKRSWTL